MHPQRAHIINIAPSSSPFEHTAPADLQTAPYRAEQCLTAHRPFCHTDVVSLMLSVQCIWHGANIVNAMQGELV